MGGGPSGPSGYRPMSTANNGGGGGLNGSYSLVIPPLNNQNSSSKSLRIQPSNAKWSIRYLSNIPPTARSEQFTVYFPDEDVAVIGYGVDKNDELLNDVWAVSISTGEWSQFPLGSNSVVPRRGAKACVHGSRIFIFGGRTNNSYVNDFHMIDANTKVLTKIPIPAGGPCGRTGHVMTCYGDNILIWGGFNNAFLNDLWLFNVTTMQWTPVQTDVNGRNDASFAVWEHYLYIVASSTSDSVIRFDFETLTLEEIDVTGNPPPFELKGASLIPVDKYLVLIGGTLKTQKYTLIRAFDVMKRWWFVMTVLPDEETTTLEDGSIDNNGYFLVPRTTYSSSVYRSAAREISMFLGTPTLDPPPIYTLEVGGSLAYLHLTSDMIEMLYII